MRGALDRHRAQVVQREIGSSDVERSGDHPPTQYRNNFEIQELRGDEILSTEPPSSSVPIGAVISQRNREDAGINDEHGRFIAWRPRP